MWRYWLWQTAGFVASLIGAVLLAALLAALSRHAQGFWPMLGAFSDTLTDMLRGDFGKSAVTGLPAAHHVAAVLPATLQLVAAGAVIALLIGVPLGMVLSASRILRAAAPLMQIIAAAPVFCAALAMIWFAVRVLHWSEATQTSALAWNVLVQPGEWNAALRAFSLPAITVGAAGIACVQLALRRVAAVALSAPYRAGLRMMGLSAMEIDLRYVLPEFFAALLRDLGDIALALLAAATVAEWVFNRDGAAVLLLKSVSFGDWNVAALILLIFAAITLGANFVGVVAARFLVPPEDAP
jgi:peptide/nickel transport system permease protein